MSQKNFKDSSLGGGLGSFYFLVFVFIFTAIPFLLFEKLQLSQTDANGLLEVERKFIAKKFGNELGNLERGDIIETAGDGRQTAYIFIEYNGTASFIARLRDSNLSGPVFFEDLGKVEVFSQRENPSGYADACVRYVRGLVIAPQKETPTVKPAEILPAKPAEPTTTQSRLEEIRRLHIP